MRSAILVAALLAAGPAMAAGDEDFDPASVRIEDALACKLDVRAYNGFAFWLAGSDDGARQLGWTKQLDGPNPMLLEYRLPATIEAFGQRTDRIAFTSNAVVALLPGMDPAALAKRLDVENILPAANRFLGERVVARTTETDDTLGMRFTYVTALSVSTVASHPGLTLAGCSYRVEEGE